MNKFFTKHMFCLDESPWPLTAAVSSLMITSGLISMMYFKNFFLIFMGIFILLFSMFQWSRDLIRESSFLGNHNFFFQEVLKTGMILFIFSEVMFFASFFWSFFHSSTAPCLELGSVWPPFGMIVINPMGIPLLNTIILLTSGVSVTWSHHSLQKNYFFQSFISLMITCLLGWLFLAIQVNEYLLSMFSFADSIYGSIFFMATGFHGMHVLLGSILLSMMGIRMVMFHFSNFHHIGYEASIWYWHFVDVVWLFLFSFVYFWAY